MIDQAKMAVRSVIDVRLQYCVIAKAEFSSGFRHIICKFLFFDVYV